MLLSNRGENDALTDICPRSILVFSTNFAIDVFTPSAEIIGLLDGLTDGGFGRRFMDVCIASVVIGQSAINRCGDFLDTGCFF